MRPLHDGADPRRRDNTIELKLRDVTQLSNPLDPSPLPEKDLSREVEEFILGWAHELPPRGPLRLVVRLGTPLPPTHPPAEVEEAIGH